MLNSLMTLPFIITVLFCLGDADALLASPISLLSPYTQIALNSTGSVGASVLLGASSTMIAFTAGFALWGAAARSVWSLARDGGLPETFAKVNRRFDVPVMCVLVLLPPAIPITMIYIWNVTAFYGVMSGVLVAFQLSYSMPICLNVLYARHKKTSPKGQWSMGRAGVFVDVVALCFTIFMVTFMSFPVYMPVTASNM